MSVEKKERKKGNSKPGWESGEGVLFGPVKVRLGEHADEPPPLWLVKTFQDSN